MHMKTEKLAKVSPVSKEPDGDVLLLVHPPAPRAYSTHDVERA
jgi:hypothetical protein